jgi:hypothetical protein
MEKYLTDCNIKYKIIGINNSYKFELNDITFIYCVGGCKDYHHLTMYVSSPIFEKIMGILEGIIPLIGVIENINIYKYEGYYKTFNEIVNILGIIQFGKRYKWIKATL